MADRNYRYKSDCEGVNLENDDLYDYVLERDNYQNLSHQDPRCMKHAFDVKEYDMKEHFGNLDGISFWHIILILIAIYIVYYFFFRGY